VSAEPLRILLANDHLGWGGTVLHGVGKLFLLSIPRFDPARVRVVPVILRRRDALARAFDEAGISIRFLARGKFDPRTYFDLRRIVGEERIDVLHLQGYGAATFGRLVAARTGVPAVVTVHSVDPRYPRYMRLPDRLLARRTARFLYMNDTLRDFCVQRCSAPLPALEKLPLGIDLAAFRGGPDKEEARRAIGIGENEAPVVGTVTRLFEQKGNRYLLEAWRTVAARVPRAVLVVAGDGPERAALEESARAHGLAGRTRFLGFRDDVPAVLRAFDVAVLASLWEATPLAGFESMAAGLPIVATAVDGLSEVLEDGRTALLVPPASPSALAAAILRLADDAALAERLAGAAREESRRYSIEEHVRRLTEVYESAAAASREAAR